jgi:hypothetical protein
MLHTLAVSYVLLEEIFNREKKIRKPVAIWAIDLTKPQTTLESNFKRTKCHALEKLVLAQTKNSDDLEK